MDLTICLALDERTSGQLEQVWPTWRHFKPWILDFPWLLICDTLERDLEWWQSRLAFLGGIRSELQLWSWGSDLPQRERMLTAFVQVPPRMVRTEYWAKIDTDVVATGPEPWPLDDWLEGSPAIVGHPCGYTRAKPEATDWPAILDAWGDGIEALENGPRLNFPPAEPGQDRWNHQRICSWCALFRTNFSHQCSQFAPGQLPVPSEDTFHWYCATRLGELVRREKMNRQGWATRTTVRGRAALIRDVLGQGGEGCCG